MTSENWYKKGYRSFTKGNYKEALRYTKKAISEEPDKINSWTLKANIEREIEFQDLRYKFDKHLKNEEEIFKNIPKRSYD